MESFIEQKNKINSQAFETFKTWPEAEFPEGKT